MNNLLQNYEKILTELQKYCANVATNFQQKRKPKFSNIELAALNFTAEYMSIYSENQLFMMLKGTFIEEKIERSNYNKRKRRLVMYLSDIQRFISEKFADFTNVFIIDATPLKICENARANRSDICKTYDVQPAFGFCAAKKEHYFGYKLHAVCNRYGIIHSFDFTPANVHEINYLKDVKYNLQNCELIGDRGYISADYQADLFNYAQIKLSVPMRKNQQNFTPFIAKKAKIRRRIETVFSQLNGQFSLQKHLAKTLNGLITRVISKIAAFTFIQFLNFFVLKRPINHTKQNLF
jgi:hypothetical protein